MLPITPTTNEINRIRTLATYVDPASELIHWQEQRGSTLIDYWFELGQWFVAIAGPNGPKAPEEATEILQANARQSEEKPRAAIGRELEELIARGDPSIIKQAGNDALRWLAAPHNYIQADIYTVEDLSEIARLAEFLRTSLSELNNIVKTLVISKRRKLTDALSEKDKQHKTSKRSPSPRKDPAAVARVSKKIVREVKDPVLKKLHNIMMVQNLDIDNWASMNADALREAIGKAMLGKAPVKGGKA